MKIYIICAATIGLVNALYIADFGTALLCASVIFYTGKLELQEA